MSKLKMLQEAALAATSKATEIAEVASKAARDLTPEEQCSYDAEMAKARDLLSQIKTAKADQEILDAAKALAEEIGTPEADTQGVEAGGDSTGARVKRLRNLGFEIVNHPVFKAAIKPFTKDSGEVALPNGVHFGTGPIPVKSLFTGGSETSAGAFVTPEQTGIIEMLGRRPLRLRDLISVRTTGSDTVEFVRQVSHTNNAAPVAEATSSAAPSVNTSTGEMVLAPGGGYKPEGAWGFEKVTASVKTIAEWVPATKRAIADAKQLEGLIRDELTADVAETEEAQILAGDGSGENLPGILSTSGTQAQVFDTDIFVSTRKALTKVRTVGRAIPSGIALNPIDMETVDLARENGTSGKFLGAGPFALGPRTLWGVPLVEVEGLPQGTALVGDFAKAVLWDREQTTVSISDSHADFFVRNLVAVLAEERVAFGVTRPSAFVVTDVAA